MDKLKIENNYILSFIDSPSLDAFTGGLILNNLSFI